MQSADGQAPSRKQDTSIEHFVAKNAPSERLKILDALKLKRVDADARLMKVPLYCLDQHTRRGSGYPLHLEKGEMLLRFKPLINWSTKEWENTHADISKILREDRKNVAAFFFENGAIVARETFPGPPFSRGGTSVILSRGGEKQASGDKNSGSGAPQLSWIDEVVWRSPCLISRYYVTATTTSKAANAATSQRELNKLIAGVEVDPTENFLKNTLRVQTSLNTAKEDDAGVVDEDSLVKPPPAVPVDPFYHLARLFAVWKSENKIVFKKEEEIILKAVLAQQEKQNKRRSKEEQTLQESISLSNSAFSGAAKGPIDARPSAVFEKHRQYLSKLPANRSAGGTTTGSPNKDGGGEAVGEDLSIAKKLRWNKGGKTT